MDGNKHRVEIKSPFPVRLHQTLISKLLIAGAREIYTPRYVTSIYFDTIELDNYINSIEGVLPRNIIRLRTYSENIITNNSLKLSVYKNNNFVLERKESRHEGDIKKIQNCSNPFNLLINGLHQDGHSFYPKTVINYLRTYFILMDVRLTVDIDIQYSDDINRCSYFMSHNECVLELKSEFQYQAEIVLSHLGLSAHRFSKYCLSIENLFSPQF